MHARIGFLFPTIGGACSVEEIEVHSGKCAESICTHGVASFLACTASVSGTPVGKTVHLVGPV